MKFIYLKSISWSPAILRGTLWICIAMVKCYIDAVGNATPAKMHMWGWIEWSVMICSIILEGMIAARLYLDQSLGQLKQKIEDEKDKNAIVDGSHSTTA